MGYRAVADLIVVVHLAFVLFVVVGGVFVRRWHWTAFIHVPCAAYGAAIEMWGWTCPLTPLENRLRALAGERGYTGGFVEHYLVHILYPEPLSKLAQAFLGVFVVVANAAIYAWAFRRWRTSSRGRRIVRE